MTKMRFYILFIFSVILSNPSIASDSGDLSVASSNGRASHRAFSCPDGGYSDGDDVDFPDDDASIPDISEALEAVEGLTSDNKRVIGKHSNTFFSSESTEYSACIIAALKDFTPDHIERLAAAIEANKEYIFPIYYSTADHCDIMLALIAIRPEEINDFMSEVSARVMEILEKSTHYVNRTAIILEQAALRA